MLTYEEARRALLAREGDLVRRRGRLHAEQEVIHEERSPDFPDAAADRTTDELLAGLDDAERVQLARVRGALKRIEDGSYGTCVVCGQPIPTARLRVLPEADRCAECSNSH